MDALADGSDAGSAVPVDAPHYVAMGSSYGAGPGIAPVLDRGALRSGRNYAHQLARRRGLRLTDVTCSSATTDNLLRTPQRTSQGTRPPQIDAVTSGTRLVTVTAGGNDIGYIPTLSSWWIQGAIAHHLPFGRTLAARFDDRVGGTSAESDAAAALATADALATAMTELVERVQDRAPHALVVLLDYLCVLGDDVEEWAGLRLGPHQLARLRAMADLLSRTLGDVAERTGARFVSAAELSRDHGLGSDEPWVTGLELGNPWKGGPVPFHPKLAGMTAVADALATLPAIGRALR